MQLNFYHYLYVSEDINILAAFEVYLITRDLNDFIDTLLLIMKLYYFRFKSKFVIYFYYINF